MTNLKNVYDNIFQCLVDLYDFDMLSGYQDLVNELSEQIDLLGAYFGVRMLKTDVGPFKKDEMVYITQDEAGAWINSIDYNDKRTLDLFDESIKSSIDDWFYPIPEPPVDVN